MIVRKFGEVVRKRMRVGVIVDRRGDLSGQVHRVGKHHGLVPDTVQRQTMPGRAGRLGRP